MDITLFQQQQPHQQTQQHPHQQHVVIDSKDDKTIKKRIDSAIAMKSNNQLLHISLEHPPDHIYLPGEEITGTVNISQLLLSTTWKQSTARIDVHLSCSFKACDAKKQSVFKLMTNPIWISLSDMNKAAFSLTIPSHLPAYSTHDKSINGRIEYKLKAVYEITDLPLSLYPKTSIPVLISAQISTADPDYTTPMQNEKEIVLTIPRDVVLRKSTLRKGDTGLVSAKLVIPHSCFLPGESIPFALYIQHIAPIKQAQGIHVVLERITTITTPTEEKRSVTTIKTLNLPLLCNVDDHAATVNSSQQLRIPEATAPTLETASNKLIPFAIHYRLKALVNMDMHQFMEEIPQRKRDRAYNMMSKMMMVAAATSSDQQGVGPAFFYSTTIELDLPIRIGTTHEPIITTNNAPKHHSLPYPLHIASSTSSSFASSRQLMASPEQYEHHHVNSIQRFDSDPTFDRQRTITSSSSTTTTTAPTNRSSVSTIAEYLTLPCTEAEIYDRPPSAPPLTDIMDPPPPCYMTE
ncbi:hypothetical protein FB192DRAFT_1383002 [Mucor lusitanicus]|uniref:Arrestin C-terminal-like domain-containing protein n=1 Tax=Mucor circinelloides f. lusitanicus TaxID=29924 RepID=A0A8H4BF12_MUCCL|nr:hypothetical protein FB192DRAFT_1383002 [Mucor lusitanicus]